MMAKERPKVVEKKAGSVRLEDNMPKQPKQQEQPKLTEEQAFMGYTNQVISNLILDMEATKGRAVDSVKSLIQQLSMYMNLVKKLEEEKKVLEGKLKKK